MSKNKKAGAKVNKSNSKADEAGVNVARDHVNDFNDYIDDIIGNDENIDSDDEEKATKKNRYEEQEDDNNNKIPPYMFFDFRKGADNWPSNVELVDSKRAEELLEKATLAMEELVKRKKKDDDEDEGNKKESSTSTVTFGSWNDLERHEEEEPESSSVHPDASFETLKDGSTAFIIKPGYRLKLKLNDLQEGGDENKLERERKALKQKKRAAKFAASASSWVGGGSSSTKEIDFWDLSNFESKKWFKEYINEYTITFDIKLMEAPPRDGISLFQTALIHCTESRNGKTTLSRSDGECIINQSGGLGIFGTYGDTTKARLDPGVWRRVVVSVKCSDKQTEKGELKTWISTEAGVVLKEETIVANGRFAIDPDNLFIFSAAQSAMMPGNVAIRTIRVEMCYASDKEVRSNRARDKLLSIFDEERKKEAEEQRKGLALASLFAKPRPMWLAPTFVATFGDAFIEKSTLEGSSNLAWSYSVLNFALQRVLKSPLIALEGSVLDYSARVGLSNSLHILQQSAPIFKTMVRMLKTPNESQLLSFLRKLKKMLLAIEIGESIILPALVEGSELIILLERMFDRLFQVTIVQTDPYLGLCHHSVSPVVKMPDISYRTCMVLTDVPKKNVLDDVFWMALYNMAINHHEGDMHRFYDVLLPFLIDKPLEVSLVEAENAAAGVTIEKSTSNILEQSSSESKSIDNSNVLPIKSLEKIVTRDVGDWRLPQRSNTAYVRCTLEVFNFLLRKKGVNEIQAKQIHLSLCYEMIKMMENDLHFILPNHNGFRVCSLAIKELSHTAVDFAEQSSDSTAVNDSPILREVYSLVKSAEETLSYCKDDDTELPPCLDLSEPKSKSDPQDPALTQFCDHPSWDVLNTDCDPGQAVALQKYIPVDLLLIPVRAITREQAIAAIRICDRQCSLIDNQSHCIKHRSFLIVSLIEHVFVQVIPIPKSRKTNLTQDELHIASRSKRRLEKKQAEEEKRIAEKKKKIEQSKIEGKNTGSSKKNASQDSKPATINSESSSSLNCFGKDILPDFNIGKEVEDIVTDEPCIWDEPLHYELQVELLLSLQRISEHFVASSLSLVQTRPFDAVCIIVSGCLATISDALMRKIAIDQPSEMCSHLMGRTSNGRQLGLPGFGIGISTFATQSETLEIHTPELSIARTAILDYFQSPQQNRLEKIFNWEEDYDLKPGKSLIKYLRMVSKEIGLSIFKPHYYLIDENPISSNLMKNYPEFRCYRDIVFWWKYFLNTDRKSFRNYSGQNDTDIQSISRMNAQLLFAWDEPKGGYSITSFDNEGLHCRPNPKQVNPITGKIIPPEQLPTHRYPSTATPSFYVPLPLIKTEDDVIYRPNLPNFEDKYGPILNQRDSELLISYLTVPYMRIPLLLTFFSSDDRIHKLQSPELRLILDSVMFEPGKYLRLDMSDVCPAMVPTPQRDLLATPYGLLLNELCNSPEVIISSVITLLKGALACDTGAVVDLDATVFNTSTTIIIYCTRLAARFDNYLSLLIDMACGTHDCLSWFLRIRKFDDNMLKTLKEGRESIRDLLQNQIHPLFQDYLSRLDSETSKDPANEKLIDLNSRLASDLHAHMLLIYRNYHESDINSDVIKTLLGSFIYLTTRHTWNKVVAEELRLNLPETELYSLLQVQRRRIITWLSRCRQGVLDNVLQTVLQVSSSLTGNLKTSSEILDAQNRWSRIQGDRSVGRWAVGSTRNIDNSTSVGSLPTLNNSSKNLSEMFKLQRQTSFENDVGVVADTGMLGVEIDVQTAQMTLRSKHLSALHTDIANHLDVKMIFGETTMQASLVEVAEHRQVFRLVGLNHEIHYWRTAHNICPALGDEWEREYDPADLSDSERWIAALFEPVRKSFFDGPFPKPMQFMMTEKPITSDAEVVVLLGLHQIIGGPWKLVYLFRRLKCVHVYECVTQGREWFFTLHLTTDCRFSLRDMQPSHHSRMNQYPDWWIRGGGTPYPRGVVEHLMNDLDSKTSNPQLSVLIIRERQHVLNISGGREKLIPSRLLYGVIPDALLEAYRFWEDESIAPRGTKSEDISRFSLGYKRMLGYPLEEDGEYMIIVEFQYTGSWTDFHTPVALNQNSPFILQSTRFPGRTVRITRRLKSTMMESFQMRTRIASILDSSKLLASPLKKKRTDKVAADKEEALFKIDELVECNFEGKGDYIPCVINRVNDDKSYDLEFTNEYKWLGIQRSVDPTIVQTRGDGEKKKRGEGIWHWEGMSESEEDDWRVGGDSSTDDDDKMKDKDNNDPEQDDKSRISFENFDQLYVLIDAADGDEDSSIQAIQQLSRQFPSPVFNDINELAKAIHKICYENKQNSMDENISKPASSPSFLITESANDMLLLNLLYAPRRSRLHSLLKVLVRIENAGYICAWTKASGVKLNSVQQGLNYGCPSIDLVELPRLKLSLTTRPDHEGVLRLYSVDHVDLFISNDNRDAMTTKMLAGIPHSLIFSNVRGETQVLVPVIPPIRPQIASEPFSTFIVLNRKKIPLAERFFLYPVHVSFSFFMTKGLNSALYLMLLRFLHRDYATVFRLSDSVATDTELNKEGLAIYSSFKSIQDDWHPDAHACRLKISLVTIDSGMKFPWDLTIECARHAVKLDSVSSNCRMALEEELQLLESDYVVTSSSSQKFDKDIHDEFSMAICYNRQQVLRALLQNAGVTTEQTVSIRAPSRSLSTGWPYYQDNTVFGENYMKIREIYSANDGEHNWKSEVVGGDETDAPEGGWLVVAVFHTLWSAGSIKVLPAVTELVPMYQNMLTFLSVKADSQGMVSVSKELGIKVFPTFIIFRGGKELERLDGHERVIEKLIRSLALHITPEDKVAHAKHRYRIRLEKSLEINNFEENEIEELEERGQLDWTFDPEQCGESMQINENGMHLTLSEEQELDEVRWEYANCNRRHNLKWKPFQGNVNMILEKLYRDGSLYDNGYYEGGYEIWPSNITINDYEITGFKGYDHEYNDLEVRRIGDRLPVPNEDAYVTKEQRERDKRSAEWRSKIEAYKAKIKEQRIGNDIEAMRGTIGFLPNTGIHYWTFRWNHEPGRQGTGDAFGVCSDGKEVFTSTPTPSLGGKLDSGTSVGLYADGSLYHNGIKINHVDGTRLLVEIDLAESKTNDDDETNAAIETKEESGKSLPLAAAGSTTYINKCKSALYGRKSLVRCDFDTSLDGGTLTFSIDGKILEDVTLKNVYSLLGGSEIFPCVCLCPLDPLTEEEQALIKAMNDAKKKAAEDLKDKKKEEGDEEEEEEVKNNKSDEKSKDEDDGGLTDNKENNVNIEFDLVPSISLLSHEDEDRLILENNKDLKLSENKVPDALNKELTSEEEKKGTNSDNNVRDNEADDNKEKKEEEEDNEKKDSNEELLSSEVPLEKVRWMFETSEDGWVLYSTDASREIEQSSRDNKTTYTIAIGNDTHSLKLDKKVYTTNSIDGEFRIRRHVLADGLAGLWEILTIKYEKPSGLYGIGMLKILEKVWKQKETMSGKQCGLGFMFLYNLFTGESRCKITGGSSSSSDGFGGGIGPKMPTMLMFGGKKSSNTSSNDSHRFALLLTQLYVDKNIKSLPASVINILGRNRQVSLRMPKFKDTRKTQQVPFFNGWIDENEPRSPLADLFNKLVPLMSVMKKKGAFHFPPPPPHLELPPSPPSGILKITTKMNWYRPELSNYGCESYSVSIVNGLEIANLVSSIQYKLVNDTLRPVPPIHIEDSVHFESIINSAPEKLYIIDFSASWCGPCQNLSPVFKMLSLQTPTAVFLTIDIDEVDDLSERFKVDVYPTIIFLRGSPTMSGFVGGIKGTTGFIGEFTKMLKTCSNEQEIIRLQKFRSPVSQAVDVLSIVQNLSCTEEQLSSLALDPLEECNSFVTSLTRQELNIPQVSTHLAFNVSKHEAAQTAPAVSVLSRFKEDIEAYAIHANTEKIIRLNNLSDVEIISFFKQNNNLEYNSSNKLMNALQSVRELIQKLNQIKELDSKMIKDTIPLLEKAANWVSSESSRNTSASSSISINGRIKFLLNRISGQHSFVWTEFLFGILLSTTGEDDLKKLNPYLSSETLKVLFHLITICMLRASRLGHTNRCIGTAINLESLLVKTSKVDASNREEQGKILIPKLMQVSEELAKAIKTSRHYITKSTTLCSIDGKSISTYEFDPRYLVFEFVWNIQLRKKQVDIVNDFRKNLKEGNSKVKQMIMGAGKTSVVAPLLALIIADGKSLVLSVVPKALVEMSRTRMRETFAAIMVKRVYTLDFDRSSRVSASMRRSLENAAVNRGIVVATPTTLKSIMLSFIETQQRIKELENTKGMTSKISELSSQVVEFSKILALFKEGIMLLDEVDLILHPLKSELNFPIGEKFDLDGSADGERWSLPIHLFDAIFFHSTGRVSSFEQQGVTLDILQRISAAMVKGIENRDLQRLPHITLLNIEYYNETLKPLLAEWAYLWLQKQHLYGIDKTEAIKYILEGAAARSDAATKVTLLDLAICKLKISSGKESPCIRPTLAHQKSMTINELKENEENLERKRLEVCASIDSNDHTTEELISVQLEEARNVAYEHQMLVNEIYDLDENIEESTQNGLQRLSTVQASIDKLNKEILELECPRDDSLDNTVIVWYSQAFSIHGGAGAATDITSASAAQSSSTATNSSDTSVPVIVSQIEDLGWTVKCCSDADEAIARARDLQLEGRLRCFVIGGGEIGASCGPSCIKYHDGENCLRCGEEWSAHNGHNCVLLGGRGSWPLDQPEQNDRKLNTMQIMKDITDPESPYAYAHSALPANRTSVFSPQMNLKEEERLEFWLLGCTVTDDSKQLINWMNTLPGWNDVSSNSEENDDDEEEVGEKEDKNLIQPGILLRQTSNDDKSLLIKYKAELKELELKKSVIGDNEESAKKILQNQVTEKHALLEKSLNNRIEVLTNSLVEFQNLISLLVTNTTTSTTTITTTTNNTETSDNNNETFSYTIGAGPQYAREAAYALGWLEYHKTNLPENQYNNSNEYRSLLFKYANSVNNELNSLKRMSLATKVVAHITSPMLKKLLNLCQNWLSTYLPHCLAKINRVSFGLLSTEDCKRALTIDPFVPRSRLKLAIPFIGKDVPSRSSEFAHPDVIIGLTILAYRYTGLRRDDFVDIIDALTARFSQEIGPARDRDSSLRHEKWILAAGGAIRGLKSTRDGKTWNINVVDNTPEEKSSKEVVQLKFLQKSNKEQMDKLFDLIHFEPLVIHFYLQGSVFPQYMRSQRLKLSASGQSVGGDILVGKRVGFSGTPSDLLPQELGRCDYETGDDGMMLTTCLDRDITSYEFIQNEWTVEFLLQRIATAEPKFHALIDTGALITGYSNKEVAKQLLDRGLSWCDGVIFLDDEDRQQVLVRATGRVVSADQCGVALERRFAFYDQIHTTGMDIKHVVNATAVITLGKDMVFRDYVQGAYRMRGIGVGQRVHVYVIPEVKELMQRELRNAEIPSREVLHNKMIVNDHILEYIVAWLIVNSLRSEQTQWTMLCLQNIGNLYRKNAFKCLQMSSDSVVSHAIESNNDNISATNKLCHISKEKALEVFNEEIDFSLEAGVPDPLPFEQKLRSMLDKHESFLLPDQHKIGHNIMEVVGQFSMIEGSANRLDTEQEREQEQEQEKEVEARKDQQIEVEKFVDREFSRQEETQRPWPFHILAQPLPSLNSSKMPIDHPFYRMKDFKLRHHESVEFSDGLLLSSNYFNLNWTGLRRLKNIIMVLEFIPSSEELRLKTLDDESIKLTNIQKEALRKAFYLLGFQANKQGESNYLYREDLKHAIEAFTDNPPSDELINQIIQQFSKHSNPLITLEEFTNILLSGILQPRQVGRYWVAVSLSEAETIRRILHIRKNRFINKSTDNNISSGSNVISSFNTEVALRYNPISSPNNVIAGDGGLIFDASNHYKNLNSNTIPSVVSLFESSVAHNSYRFFDCDMHYNSAALNILIRSLRSTISERERFFQSTVGCRRRMERKWQETPLAKVFTIPDEWIALKQQAQVVYIIEALKDRNISLWEAFTIFDFDNNGMISPAEFYGGLLWLNMPNITPEDVLDFFELADTNRDGAIDYKEYMDLLSCKELVIDAVLQSEDDQNENIDNSNSSYENKTTTTTMITKVEPYGIDILRELIIHRKQKEQAHTREVRLKKLAYNEALDLKIFEEELEASKLRVGGANPNVSFIKSNSSIMPSKIDTINNITSFSDDFVDVNKDNICIIDYRFTTNQHPLRFNAIGKSSFMPIYIGTAAYHPIKPMKCDKNHDLGEYDYYWQDCTRCKKRHTKKVCWTCYVFYCMTCFDGHRRSKEIERRDPTNHPTFLRCSNACSFTLQIPETIKSINEYQEHIDDYTITLELRFEKLPIKGTLQSLLRFSLPDLVAQARKTHRTSVYLNGDGIIVGRPIEYGGGVEEKDTTITTTTNITDITTTDITITNITTSNITTTAEEEVEHNTEIDSPLVVDNTSNNIVKNTTTTSSTSGNTKSILSLSPRIRAGQWTVISIVVQPLLGALKTYIDGKLCHQSYDLDPFDLKLQHKVVVLGGGKQAHIKGGDVRRIVIHKTLLNPKQLMELYIQLANEHPFIGGRVIKIQCIYRGYITRKLIKNKNKKELEKLKKEDDDKSEESPENETNDEINKNDTIDINRDNIE